MRRTSPPASGATSTAATRDAPCAPTTTDFATIGRPAARAACGSAPSRALPARGSTIAATATPAPCSASAVAYALSLLANTTAREPGRTA